MESPYPSLQGYFQSSLGQWAQWVLCVCIQSGLQCEWEVLRAGETGRGKGLWPRPWGRLWGGMGTGNCSWWAWDRHWVLPQSRHTLGWDRASLPPLPGLTPSPGPQAEP